MKLKTLSLMVTAMLAGAAPVMAQTTQGSKTAVSMNVSYAPLQGCFTAPELRVSKEYLEQILGEALRKRGVTLATSAESAQMSVYLSVQSCKNVSNGEVDAYAVSFGIVSIKRWFQEGVSLPMTNPA